MFYQEEYLLERFHSRVDDDFVSIDGVFCHHQASDATRKWSARLSECWSQVVLASSDVEQEASCLHNNTGPQEVWSTQ
jgi:hypothetical protein